MKRLILLAVVLVVGCANYGMPSDAEVEAFQNYLSREYAKIDSIMKSFEGDHFFSAIATLGPYDEEIDDGQGGKILIWRIKLQTHLPGSVIVTELPTIKTTTARFNAPQTKEFEDFRMIWVDNKGIVYKTAWKGLGVRSIPAQLK